MFKILYFLRLSCCAVISTSAVLGQSALCLRSEWAWVSGTGGLRLDRTDFAGSGDARALQHWSNLGDSAKWEVTVLQPGKVRLAVVLSSGDQTSGGKFEVRVDGRRLTGTVPDTGGWQGRGAYRTVELGEVVLARSGRIAVEVRGLAMPKHALMNLKEVLLLSSEGSSAKLIANAVGPLREAPGFGAKLKEVHPAVTLTDLSPAAGPKLRVSGIDWLSDGRMVVCTWDRNGTVYIVSNPNDPTRIEFQRFAWGLSEPLGLCVVNDEIYVVQKQELTKLVDTDGDGVCDLYACISNSWPVDVNFHQFTFGPVFKDGYFYLALAVSVNNGGATTRPQVKDRGCVIKVDPRTGGYEVISAGHRTPNGLAFGPEGTLFVSDNQGDWLPGSKLIHVRKGVFNGHRYEPLHPFTSKPAAPPALWLPQNELANSPTEPVHVSTGPYAGQMFFGDIHYGGIQRAALEKVDGQWQGSAHRFTAGLRGPVNRLRVSPDGSLWLGELGVIGNWTEPGKKQDGLERLAWNGTPVFDLVSASARANGFVLNFTEPLSPGLGWDPAAYEARQWRYQPTGHYGGPKLDEQRLEVKSASVAADRRSVFLETVGMKEGSVILLRVDPNFESEGGRRIWSGDAFYTLNRIPRSDIEAVRTAPANFIRYTSVPVVPVHPGAVVHKTHCASCHSVDGSKLVGPSFKDLAGSKQIVISDGKRREITVDEAYLRKSIANPEADVVEGYQAIMPNLAAAMEPGQLDAVVDYMLSLNNQGLREPNTLTESEKKDGWKLLFDGSSLAGWQRYREADAPIGWTVDDGALAWTGKGAGDIATRDEYGDFELMYDWRISEGGNSGVMIRVTERGEYPSDSGIEMQVLDDDRHADRNAPSHRAGAAYDLVAPPAGVAKSAGQWNSARIVAQGPRIELYLNGTLTAKIDQSSGEWREILEKSKFASFPHFAKAERGRIVLQDHGDPVWFRNIKILQIGEP